MPIRQLAPDVAAKIAAGEVVERPASVVKELIENSIDAGATQIRVDLTHGGLQLIRVTDNGSGIPAEELPLALARHATSKVAQIDDLEHIRSLGFRGEALASIAAVADVTLISHARGSGQGMQISANNGMLSEVTPAAAPEGTIITVRNLFSAVPARLKFLKSRNTEVSHCNHLLEQYALAYPEIRFHVFSEGKQIFATPGDGQLFSVLVEIYGLQIAEQMVPFERSEHPDNPEYPIVSGFTSRPTCYKSTRQHISFFVNRRWVLSRTLTSAVEGGYHSLLLTGRHPISVINIQIDPTLLDVNVHPAKTEIRFLKERRIYAVVLRAIRAALLDEPIMPEWTPRDDDPASVGARFIAPASPTSPIDSPEGNDNAVRAKFIAPAPPTASLEGNENAVQSKFIAPTSDDDDDDDNEPPAFPQANPWLTVTEEETGSKPPLHARLWQNHHIRPQNAPQPVGAGDEEMGGEDPLGRPLPTHDDSPFETIQPVGARFIAPAFPIAPPSSPINDTSSLEITQATWTEKGAIDTDNAMGGHVIPADTTRRLPRLRVVGQLSQSYIVTEGEDGMYLLDQHAAHERILLERMVAALQARTPVSQLLLTSLQLELAPSELEAIEDHQQQLTNIGFAFEFGDDGTLAIKAVPSVLVKQMNARSLHELLLELTAAENLGHTETWEERALANVACKAAIKANYFLTVSEMREMLEQLEQTKAPFSCCHGRPTMIHFSLSSLAREFERR